jgi:hypothetical protein
MEYFKQKIDEFLQVIESQEKEIDERIKVRRFGLIKLKFRIFFKKSFRCTKRI